MSTPGHSKISTPATGRWFICRCNRDLHWPLLHCAADVLLKCTFEYPKYLYCTISALDWKLSFSIISIFQKPLNIFWLLCFFSLMDKRKANMLQPGKRPRIDSGSIRWEILHMVFMFRLYLSLDIHHWVFIHPCQLSFSGVQSQMVQCTLGHWWRSLMAGTAPSRCPFSRWEENTYFGGGNTLWGNLIFL